MVNREYDSDLTNFGTWVHDNSDRLFRFWVYRKMFTPYEQDEKFIDESPFESNECSTGYIREAIELPDGDILLGFATTPVPDYDGEDYLEYHKLSEIQLDYNPLDEEEKREDERRWRERNG